MVVDHHGRGNINTKALLHYTFDSSIRSLLNLPCILRIYFSREGILNAEMV